MKKFGYTKELFTNFVDTIESINFALKNEGFGILSKIDMKNKLKEKLDVDIEEYIILGVCNSELGYESLMSVYEIGLILPCNIIVYNKNGKTYVSTIKPTTIMNMIDNEGIKKIAKIAEEKLIRVIDSI